MNKVLQIGMTDNLGGIENYLINYYRNIDKTKVQFDFINIYPNDLCFQDELISGGSKVYKVSNYYKHPIKYIKEVKKIIKDNNYEIIHCNMNSAVMIYPLIAAKLGKAKVIIAHSHNASSDKGFVKSLLHSINKHFISLFANKFFACSDKAGKWFYSKRILNSNNYYVIKNAINTDKFKYNEEVRNNKRKELNIGKDTLVIGHVGRFNKQKNHTFLIDIFNELHKKNNNSKLILVGIGPLYDEIENKIKQLNLSDDVLLLGQRNDVNELMQAMDIFVLPSLYEGLPLVGVEAQASGLNCIFSSSVTNTLSLFDKNKFISLKDSASYWADTILDNKENDRSNCFKIVNEKGFNISIEANRLINIYNDILGDKNE